MAVGRQSAPITLRISSTNSVVHDIVNVINKTKGFNLKNIAVEKYKLNASKQALITLPAGWEVGDVCEVRITGSARSGISAVTLTAGGQNVSVTVTTNPTGRIEI